MNETSAQKKAKSKHDSALPPQMHECYAKAMPRIGSIHDTRHGPIMKCQATHRAMAIPATARSPAATEPTFFVAAPVKLVPDPVFDGETGVIGEPEAAPDPEPTTPEPDPEPDPELELDPEPAAPVAKEPDALVPVASPVAPATPLVLSMEVSRRATIVNKSRFLTQQLWSLCMNIPYQSMWTWMYIQWGRVLSCWKRLIETRSLTEMLCLMRMPRLKLRWSMLMSI